MPGEIVIDADWYDYEAKYQPGGMELVVPGAAGRDGARARPRAGRARCSAASAAPAWRACDFFVEDPEGERACW